MTFFTKKLAILIASLTMATAAFADDNNLQDATFLKNIYSGVQKDSLVTFLRQMAGAEPVTVNNETFTISERYSPAGKANYRKFWRAYFESLGATVTQQAYATKHRIGETQGHNLEAVFPGKSKDSVVIIVHYDSTGPASRETQNPGFDDDMTGMSVSLETARLLKPYAGKLKYTVRFVAADYEEHAYPALEGARYYAQNLKKQSTTEGFKIVAAVDNEQIGWNCKGTGECNDTTDLTFDVYSCSGDSKNFDYKAMGDAFESVAATYSTLKTERKCIGGNSDHYAMWEIGVPSVVYSEHNAFDNPHFDQNGGDTFDKIDQEYFYRIAQVGVTFAASLVGIETSFLPYSALP